MQLTVTFVCDTESATRPQCHVAGMPQGAHLPWLFLVPPDPLTRQ